MKILFVGDLMCHDEQLMRMKFGDTYNFDQSFSEIKNTFKRYDYVIGNLETVLTNGPYNGYPKFSTPKSFCGSAIKAGMNVFMLANNHICDRGINGVKSTINYLESNDILYTGVSIDSNPKPIVIENTAIINYTSKMNVNDDNVIYNNLNDFTSIKKEIDKLKKTNVKSIIAVVHWGNEYEKEHSREQETIAKKLMNLGVNVIIGSHPHVIQDYNENIIYSMGNFLSSQIEPECKKSIGVEINIKDGWKLSPLKIINFNIFEDNGIIKVKEI